MSATQRTALTVWMCLGVVLISHTGGSQVRAFPEPALVTNAWELDFEFESPRPIAVRDVDGHYRWFWYMTYQVINRSNEDQVFTPEVTVATDSGRVFHADQGVPSTVFKAVQQLVKNPLLESSSQILGPLRQGEDHLKEGVAIWAAPPEDVDHMTVFFTGLAGEIQSITHPATGETVLLRKTLMIDYELPGTSASLQNQPIFQRAKQWIMR